VRRSYRNKFKLSDALRIGRTLEPVDLLGSKSRTLMDDHPRGKIVVLEAITLKRVYEKFLGSLSI
jgi:hypothetical protein